MSLNTNTYKMDIGRLMILPIFSFLVVSNIVGFYGDAKTLGPVGTIKVSTLIHSMLVICFYALVVFLYFIRSSAKLTIKSFAAKIIAVVSSFLPFAIPFMTNPSDNFGILLSANLITIFGMIISLYSMGALGRSFSIVPQVRTLVQTGPYRLIRHPLYLGELISLSGIVLARFSISCMVIFCLITAMQIYRALEEERLLAGTFPEYESYSLKRARFIPGIY